MREWAVTAVFVRRSVAALASVASFTLLACGGEDADRPDGAVPAGDSASANATTESTTMSPAGATNGTGAIRVLFIGTSLTAGMGLDPDSAYPAVIERLADEAGYDITVNAQGLSGETSAGALRRVGWVLGREKPDVVVIETGANDGLRALRVDSTQANIVGIIHRVRAAHPQARVLLAQMEAPPNMGARYTRDFHDLFMNVARDQQVTLIPFFLEGIAGEPSLNQGDGIHPNEEGARRAAQNMWAVLGPVLQQVPGAFRR